MLVKHEIIVYFYCFLHPSKLTKIVALIKKKVIFFVNYINSVLCNTLWCLREDSVYIVVLLRVNFGSKSTKSDLSKSGYSFKKKR